MCSIPIFPAIRCSSGTIIKYFLFFTSTSFYLNHYQVVKAMGILELLKEELATESDEEKIEFLSTSFYQTLTHTTAGQIMVDNEDAVAQKQGFCQVYGDALKN